MLHSKKAFTMLELVFVIVILGILSSVAITKLSVTRDDAIIAKGRNQVHAIRSAISLQRSKNMLRGSLSYPSSLDDAALNTEHEELFDGNLTNPLLEYPIYSKSKDGWMKVGANSYDFNVMGTSVRFNYNSSTGKFDCNHSVNLCKQLTE